LTKVVEYGILISRLVRRQETSKGTPHQRER